MHFSHHKTSMFLMASYLWSYFHFILQTIMAFQESQSAFSFLFSLDFFLLEILFYFVVVVARLCVCVWAKLFLEEYMHTAKPLNQRKFRMFSSSSTIFTIVVSLTFTLHCTLVAIDSIYKGWREKKYSTINFEKKISCFIPFLLLLSFRHSLYIESKYFCWCACNMYMW